MTVIEVIEAIDGPIDLNQHCILSLDVCTDEESCALHDYWKMFREQYFSTISSMTLAEAAAALEKKRLAISAAI